MSSFTIPNPDAAISDISNASLQEDLADSLVDGREEQEEPEAEAELQEHELPQFEQGDDQEDLKKLGLEPETEDGEAETEQEAEAQEAEGTEGEFQTLTEAVEAYGLVDEQATEVCQQSINESAPLLGIPAESVNTKQYTHLMGELTYAATTEVLQAGGNWQGPIPPDDADRLTRATLNTLGIDSRLIGHVDGLKSVDTQAVGNVIWAGVCNVVRSIRDGVPNDPQMAVWFMEALNHGMGDKTPASMINPAHALMTVDAWRRAIESNYHKLMSPQQRQSRAKAQQPDDELFGDEFIKDFNSRNL